MLIGEAGTGKTAVAHRTRIGALPERGVRMPNNPALTRAEFVEVLSQRFNLGPDAGESRPPCSESWMACFANGERA